MDTGDGSSEFPTFGLSLGPDPCGRLTGCVIHGKYELLKLIGQGGFGCVFRARQKSPNRFVAVKVSQHEAGQAERMVVEANVLATLDHPNIAKVHESDTWDSPVGRRRFVVMELVPGAKPFSPEYCLTHVPRIEDRVRKFIQVCEAVGVAHEKGIVHRDLKPSNVLVNSSGQPKVIDFGIAKVLDAIGDDTHARSEGRLPPDEPRNGTKTGMCIGTEPYASPEQMSGKPVTPRADVHALGKMLEKMVKDKQDRVVAGLRQVVNRCLRENPQERFADARQLAAALDRWLRRRAWIKNMSAATAALAAAVAVGFTIWNYIPRKPITDGQSVALRPSKPVERFESVTAASDPGGRWFAMASGADEITISSQVAPQVVTARLRLGGAGARALVFDAKGEHLAAVTGDHYHIWTMAELEKDSRGITLPSPAHGFDALAPARIDLAADGQILFAQSGDRDVVAVRTSDGKEIGTLHIGDIPDTRVTGVCRGPHRETAFVAASDGTVTRWSIRQTTGKRLDGRHAEGPTLLASSPAGDRMASLGADGVLRVRSAAGKTEASRSGLGQPLALAFTDASHIIAATTAPVGDDQPTVTRYEVKKEFWDIRLVLTGTASLPKPVVHLTATGTAFLGVTLRDGKTSVTEVWSPSSAPTVAE